MWSAVQDYNGTGVYICLVLYQYHSDDTYTISWPKYTVSETYTYIIVTEAYQQSDDSIGPFQSKYCAIRSLTYGWPIIPLLIHPAPNTITYLRVQLITQQRHNITIFTCN